MKVKIFTI